MPEDSMMENLKKILIVDDSEIDREVLKSILADEFRVVEADNGYSALETILKKEEDLDAILLDVSMPVLDGLSVLRILRENDFDNVPVFMITAEATKDNIEKASQYNISEFIRKPFDREDILKRVRSKLGVTEKVGLTETDIEETRRYISDLESIYARYLSFSGKDNLHDERRADFMKMLLEKCPTIEKGTEYDGVWIEIICKATYFCNIGNMLLQNIPVDMETADEETVNDMKRQHAVMGADFIKLNYSRHCRWFVQICADMCLHHHERYDGNGFPHGIGGSQISIYTQICSLLDKFDELFFKYSRHNEMQFDYVINQLKEDEGLVSDEVFSLLVESKADIINYYNENYV